MSSKELTIAVVEAHGPHMDLSADIYYAYLFSRFLKKNLCAKCINTVIAPPYYWGINNATEKYPGSFTVRQKHLMRLCLIFLVLLKNGDFLRCL